MNVSELTNPAIAMERRSDENIPASAGRAVGITKKGLGTSSRRSRSIRSRSIARNGRGYSGNWCGFECGERDRIVHAHLSSPTGRYNQHRKLRGDDAQSELAGIQLLSNFIRRSAIQLRSDLAVGSRRMFDALNGDSWRKLYPGAAGRRINRLVQALLRHVFKSAWPRELLRCSGLSADDGGMQLHRFIFFSIRKFNGLSESLQFARNFRALFGTDWRLHRDCGSRSRCDGDGGFVECT